MVGGDVEEHGNVGVEIIHVFKLEARKLDYIHVVVLASHLQGQTAAHVAGQAHVDAGVLEYVIGEQCGGGLAV